MDIRALIERVKTSVLLSAAERAYWIKNIPMMTEEQLKRLFSILMSVPDVPLTKFMAGVVHGAQAMTSLS